ncbi:MAG: 50S ribosomal protein L22 [Bacilli bacterium]|jgi:large subunit ribosomal protein L22|nr:50S ribosomal protein L22 [Bacilli bacterium]MDY0063936.1 50S ribosomal protein L22 [Bacilli bacterium]
MEVKAVAKTVRIAPRKVRLVVDLIRGKKVGEALSILRLTPKGSSMVVEKVVRSAVANAVNNNKMDQKLLYVKKAFVDEGVTMKRYLPRAKGSANSLLKRTSHITIVLEEKE